MALATVTLNLAELRLVPVGDMIEGDGRYSIHVGAESYGERVLRGDTTLRELLAAS